MKQSRSFHRREMLKLLGLVPLTFIPRASRALESTGPTPPNVLIVLFDALSARHMSLYGYPRETMPLLAQAAESAAVYHSHTAAGSFTTPSTGSFLSGTYPWTHRALQGAGTMLPEFRKKNLFTLLNPVYDTFSYTHNRFANVLLNELKQEIDEPLRRNELFLHASYFYDRLPLHDYKLLNKVEELIFFPQEALPIPSSHFLSRIWRSNNYSHQNELNRQYQDMFPRGVPNYYTMFFTLEQAIDWLNNQVQRRNAPYLGYIHLLPPHHPYTTRAEFENIFDDGWTPPQKPEGVFSEGRSGEDLALLRQHYDEYIRYVDAEFYRLFQDMQRNGLLENTYLIFTSDHGEMFERGIWMHVTPVMYEQLLHVPLLIWGPGIEGRQDITQPTSTTDILPTLMQIAGQSIPPWCEGQPLPGFETAPIDPERSVFSVEARRNPALAPLEKVSISLRKGPHKLTYYSGYFEGIEDIFELYDLENDPEEFVNLYRARPAAAARLKEELLDKLADVNRRF